jgi:segregation and condensation protein B
MDPGRLKDIVEAVLVTAEEPVTPGKLLGLLKEANGRQLREAVDQLKLDYEESGRAFTIAEVAGGFQLATRAEFGPWVRKFHDRNQVRLSQAGLETLAIVAFKQPITRAEIDSIRGVNSGGVMNHLLELNMIRIVGRSDGVGKPHLFGTTKEFLVHFGLRGLADLPKPRELEELLAAGARKAGDSEAEAGLAEEETIAADPGVGDSNDETQESEIAAEHVAEQHTETGRSEDSIDSIEARAESQADGSYEQGSEPEPGSAEPEFESESGPDEQGAESDSEFLASESKPEPESFVSEPEPGSAEPESESESGPDEQGAKSDSEFLASESKPEPESFVSEPEPGSAEPESESESGPDEQGAKSDSESFVSEPDSESESGSAEPESESESGPDEQGAEPDSEFLASESKPDSESFVPEPESGSAEPESESESGPEPERGSADIGPEDSETETR